MLVVSRNVIRLTISLMTVQSKLVLMSDIHQLSSAFRALFASYPVALKEMSPLYCWWLSPRIDYLPWAISATPRLLTCLLMVKFANSFAVYLWLVYLQCHSSGLTYNTSGKIKHHFTFSPIITFSTIAATTNNSWNCIQDTQETTCRLEVAIPRSDWLL